MGIRGPSLAFLTGLAFLALALFASHPASATPKTPVGAFTTLYSFCQEDGCADGYYPASGVVTTSPGTVFGTTCEGGADGEGAVFSITKTGTETVRASFNSDTSGECPDYANLLQVSATEFFGTTYEGGANGCGTAFKLSKNGSGKWVLTTIYSFGASEDDACYPEGGLVKDAKGNLYGTTVYGGLYSDYSYCVDEGEYGCGTVYELSPPKKSNGAWTEQVVYAFCAQEYCYDGSYPGGTLAIDKGGTLYGTTYYGGEDDGGALFAIPPYGGEAVLYSFCQEEYCYDGWGPWGVALDAEGNIYGFTEHGGTGYYYYEDNDGEYGGTVFKLSTKGHFSTLYSFCSQGGSDCTDGYEPWGTPVIDKTGKIYGTAEYGGTYTDYSETCDEYGCGVVFEIVNQSSEAVIHAFNGTDGEAPSNGVTMDAKGNLYGVTEYGGSEGYGTVFKLTP